MRQIRWSIWVASLLALAGMTAGALALHERQLEYRLVSMTPEDISQNRALVKFATSVAKPVIAARCALCHGADLRGNHERGVPDLTDGDWLYGAGEIIDVEKTITYGIRSHNPRGWNLAVMPAFGTPIPSATLKLAPLSPAEIADVTDFLLSAEKRPADAAAAGRGAAIYQGKGGCYDCHGADLRGDAAIGAPDLADNVWLYGDGSRRSIYQSIARGHQGSCPAWIHRLTALQIRALATYIHFISGNAAATTALN